MQDGSGSGMADAAESVTGVLGKAQAPGRLTFRTKFLYGMGQFVDSVSNTSLTYFSFFYLTAVCGMSGTLAGTAAFIALTFDSVADPAIGLLSDNTRTRLGRRHPYMFAALVPIAVSFALFFAIPRGFSGTTLFVYATATLILLRISLSLFYLPYIALGAELTDDYHERSVIVAYRVLLGMIANFLFFGLALGVFMPGTNGMLNRAAYAPFAVTFSVIMLAGGLVGALGTRSTIARLHVASPRTGSVVRQFLRELGEIFRNSSFVALFSACLIFFVAQGAAASLTLHANKYFWHLPASVVQGVFYGLVAFGPLVGIPVTALLSRVLEKRTISVSALLVFCLCQFFPPVIKIMGLLPDSGPTLFAVLVGNSTALGASLTAGVISFQSMMADAADEHEHLFGTRREALFYAGLTLSAKSASGLGALIAGVAMDAIHFPSNLAANGAALHLEPEVLRNLGLISGPLPALMTAFAAFTMFGYGLNRRKHADIQHALAAKQRAA